MLHRIVFSLVVFRGDFYIALHSAQSDESINNIKVCISLTSIQLKMEIVYSGYRNFDFRPQVTYRRIIKEEYLRSAHESQAFTLRFGEMV
jgi:hypothetical protein